MDSFNLIEARVPIFLWRAIIQKMDYKSLINLARSSKLGLELVEMFGTQDFKDYCNVKAEIYKNFMFTRRKLQKTLRCSQIKTLDELMKMREEWKAAVAREMTNFIEDKNTDFMVYIIKLHRIMVVKELINENIDLWSQLLM